MLELIRPSLRLGNWSDWETHLYFKALVVALLFACMLVSSSKHARAEISETTKSDADALLQLIAQNKELDAYLHTLALKQELATEPSPARRSEIYKEIIFHALDMGDNDTLKIFSDKALELAYDINDTELRIYGELALANLQAANGELDRAQITAKKAKALALRENDETMVFFADAILAILGPDLGNHLEGLSRMAQGTISLPETQRGNEMRMLAYLTLGYTYAGIGEPSEIIRYYRLAAELGEQTGIALDRESVFFNVASSLSDAHENALARQYFEALKGILQQTGRMEGTYYILYGLAWVEYAEDNLNEAIALAREALESYPAEPSFDSSLRDLIAISYARLGDAKSARGYMNSGDTAYRVNPDFGTNLPEAQKQLTLAYVLKAEGKLEEAFEMLDKARRGAVDASYEQFKNSVADLRTNLQTMLEKQQAEDKLKETEDAYSRMTVVFSILIALCAAAVLFMQFRHTRALQKSMLAAELANRSKSDFLANMSHELRTPLNAILGFSEMMTQEVFGKLGAKQYEDYAQHIHGSGKHLLDIINDILDLSKVESGRLVLQETDIDLQQMFDDAKALLAPRANERGVDLSVHVDKDVPLLRADWRLLKQILLNLLSNGVKFTDRGGRVNLIAHFTKEGAIQIEVIDSGMGMEPHELEEALTPFGQAGTTMTRSHEGTGLGLPLVQSLVELHGGELFIRSKRNIGTTVQILMPVSRSIPAGAPILNEQI